MSLFFNKNKFQYSKVNCNSDPDTSESDHAKDEEEDVKPDINKPQKSTARGKLAALISNLDNSDSDDSDAEDDKAYLKSRGGIYTKRLNQTKKEKKVINNKFYEVDKNLVNETDESQSVSQSKNSDSDTDKSLEEMDSEDSTENAKKKRLEEESEPEPEIELPPPPPTTKNRRGRKSSIIDKQFKELESFRNNTETKRLLNDSDRVTVNSEDEVFNTVTVRVSTKSGLKKWDIEETQSFRIIFDKLAEIENTGVENIVLMLKDRIINFNDTPASVNLKAYDILDCGKSASVHQERVKIIEDGEQCEHGSNMVTVNLQTEIGRKSRVKFLISMDEPFESVLKKYCDKKSLEFDKYTLQMEGDKIDLKETPRDLDFEDDYMIDVVKSSKPILQQINENRKNYEFDDDILIA